MDLLFRASAHRNTGYRGHKDKMAFVRLQNGVVELLLYFLITYSASHALLGTKETMMSEAEIVLMEEGQNQMIKHIHNYRL